MMFTEFELLTLRECLFKCKDTNLFTIKEFEEIDEKIKQQIEVL